MMPEHEKTRYAWAVIFTSRRTGNAEGYEAMDRALMKAVENQPGFLGIESISTGARSLTVSYWDSLESIRRWRENPLHREAQALGRRRWYSAYRIQVCRVEREYAFDAD
jgi:heme-degrading monooxygenase HmoA